MTTEWINALLGGLLIGLSVSLMLWWNGQVTGISGILFGFLNREQKKFFDWRLSFLLGLLAGGAVLNIFHPEAFEGSLNTTNASVALSGLLVGFGTVLGSGCTSGHGVCGISRLSVRSIVATALFILAGVASVAVIQRSFQ